uniref:Uncharacterized protein n=1 Tax=Meloidogyne hapla TaxID=6305 RepID=A0A1I8C1F9_MELHA
MTLLLPFFYQIFKSTSSRKLVDILAVFNLATPTQKEAIEDCKTLAELIRVRSVRAETISSSGVLGGFEPPLLDSKSRVLTPTLQDP